MERFKSGYKTHSVRRGKNESWKKSFMKNHNTGTRKHSVLTKRTNENVVYVGERYSDCCHVKKPKQRETYFTKNRRERQAARLALRKYLIA